ncbi:MAG: hypothetical protein DRJ41_03715 [Thermoprotei archaeon]|nr:MAG: hypothetical protein DRJ41_03715 [Thermoprotei archaeon]
MSEKDERKALRAALDERVIKVIFKPSNHELYLVESKDRKFLYVTYPGRYCSCTSYLFNLYKENRGYCYHLKALKIAMDKNLVRTVEERDEEFKKYFTKIILGIFS